MFFPLFIKIKGSLINTEIRKISHDYAIKPVVVCDIMILRLVIILRILFKQCPNF